MTFTWLACYALAVAQIGGLLRRSPVRRALDATTGAALVIFGAAGGRAPLIATAHLRRRSCPVDGTCQTSGITLSVLPGSYSAITSSRLPSLMCLANRLITSPGGARCDRPRESLALSCEGDDGANAPGRPDGRVFTFGGEELAFLGAGCEHECQQCGQRGSLGIGEGAVALVFGEKRGCELGPDVQRPALWPCEREHRARDVDGASSVVDDVEVEDGGDFALTEEEVPAVEVAVDEPGRKACAGIEIEPGKSPLQQCELMRPDGRAQRLDLLAG